MVRRTRPAVLVMAPALLAAAVLVAPATSADKETGATRDCTVRLMHRGQAVSGVRISLVAEGESHAHGAKAAPTTDSSGSMAVPVEDKLTTFTPYLERHGERVGWNLFVLASIDAKRDPGFCRDREIIELPDTLVRVNVTENGRPLPGAVVQVDNVGVRLGGGRPPQRGIVTLKAETGVDGSVEIPGLAPGVWRFLADTAESRKHAERQVAVREGASIVVDLAVAPHDRPPLPYDQREPGPGGSR